MKLGLVTYQMGQNMDVPGLIALCEEARLEGVELRIQHAHGVELSLSASERAEVKKQFDDSPVELVGLGSVVEFHSPDEAELKRNIEEGKQMAQLAADVGAGGVKVRPNALPEEKPAEKTLEQIGKGWSEVAASAADVGVEIRMEVHGSKTQEPENYLKLLAHAEHPNAKVCWNSNPADMDENKQIHTFFDAVKDRIGLVHITEIGRPQYPWADLFGRLNAIEYTGFCLAEIPHNPDEARFMTYYRMLFDLYTGQYRWPLT
jgi:sugar phosphate isomerase/epimerase